MSTTYEPSGAVLGRLADELAHWSDRALEVQTQVVAGDLASAGQELDILQQHLAGLAGFVRDLAEAERLGQPISVAAAAERLKLSDLAARLQGQPSHFSASAAGDVEMF